MNESYDIVVSALKAGDVVAGYTLVRALGEGGMGKVFLAEDAVTGTQVAIKMLYGSAATSADLVARFKNEAAAVRKINNRAFVRALQFGLHENRPYIVMEFLEGRSLGDLMRDEKRIAVGRACQLLVQIARTLYAAHQQGIVHRDVKPDNFFLVRGETVAEEVKVLDLGIAKFVENEGRIDRTKSGVVMGTPHTMSPEQCRSATKVDHRSDIYSLGVVAYYAMAGVWPFDHEDFGAFIVAHLTTPPPLLRDVAPWIPADLAEVVHKCLEKDREHRYQTMLELADALAPYADITMPLPVNLPTVQARKPTTTTHSSSSGEVHVTLPSQGSRGAKQLAGYAAFAVAVVAVAATGTVFIAKPSQSPSRPAAETTEAPSKSAEKPREAAPTTVPPPLVQGRVLLASTPSGASVTVEGKLLGQTPLLVAGKVGETVRAQLALDGYEEHSADIVVGDADRKEEVRLTPVAKNEPKPKARTERRSKSTSPKGDDYVSDPFAK